MTRMMATLLRSKHGFPLVFGVFAVTISGTLPLDSEDLVMKCKCSVKYI